MMLYRMRYNIQVEMGVQPTLSCSLICNIITPKPQAFKKRLYSLQEDTKKKKAIYSSIALPLQSMPQTPVKAFFQNTGSGDLSCVQGDARDGPDNSHF